MSLNELALSGSSALVESGSRALRLSNGQVMLLAIPDADLGEFMKESTLERGRILRLFDAFAIMASSVTLERGAQQVAMSLRDPDRGWSAKTLMDLYRVYRCGGYRPGDWRKHGPMFRPGDWRSLVRDYKSKPMALPQETRAWIVEQWSQFRGRSDCVAALYRHIVQQVWLKGKPVPGYGTIDEWCMRTGRARPHPMLARPGELPDGWSLSTFRRALPKRQATRMQVAGGYLPAHTHQPDQVLTDRHPLMPLQYVIFDDHRGDIKCLHFSQGRGEFVYPLFVGAVDACSAVDTAIVAKPRALKRAEEENAEEKAVREGVTQDMTLIGVIQTLRTFGLPEGYPMTVVHEKSAACLPSAAKHLLKEAFGDRIQFITTEAFEAKMMAHGFAERGGQPYAKALIEVYWRILETQNARLPLSTGPRYDSMPTEVKAAERYTLDLLKKVDGRIEDALAKLSLPGLTFEQAYDATVEAMRMLRFRTNHKLQGFDRVREWRMSPAENYRPIHELTSLPEEEQLKVQDIIERVECPAERFVRLANTVKFTPVDENVLTYIEGMSSVRRVTVRDGKISLRDQAISDDTLIFREVNHPLLDEDAEGRSYNAVVSADGSRMVIEKDGRILGCVYSQARVNRADPRALHQEQLRVRQSRIADREAFSQYALLDQDTAMERMRAQNSAVIAEQQALHGGSNAALGAPRRGKSKERSSTEILNDREAKLAKAGLIEDET